MTVPDQADQFRVRGQTSDDQLRLLLFSGLRLDTTYEWAPADVAEARRDAARKALVGMLEQARRQSVDAIVCAGDLFNRRMIKPANVHWLAAALRSAGVPVLIAPGSGDFVGPLGGYTSYRWPANVTTFVTEQLSPFEVADGITIWGAAHTMAHRRRSFLDGFLVDRQGINIAVFQGIESNEPDRSGAAGPCVEMDDLAIARSGLDHALIGHWSGPKFGNRFTCAGAPIAHTVGSGGPRGAVLVRLGVDGTVTRELVPIDSIEMH